MRTRLWWLLDRNFDGLTQNTLKSQNYENDEPLRLVRYMPVYFTMFLDSQGGSGTVEF